MIITYPLLLDGGLSNELERQGAILIKNYECEIAGSNPETSFLPISLS
jgi:hypothetical protein